jgi:short-subunit dehydrogenase
VPYLGDAYPALKRALEILSDYARVQLADEGIKVLVVLPYITATNFAANALGRRAGAGANSVSVRRNLPLPHTAEFVAEKVLEGLRSEATEISLVPA